MSHTELDAWWRGAMLLAYPTDRLLFRVRVDGAEHVPLSGMGILAFNHVSVLDGPLLAVEVAHGLRRRTRFMVASELMRLTVAGWILRRFDEIPVRRGQRDGSAIEEAVRAVRAGTLVAIAPEGRVSDDPDAGLQRIRSGTARIALASEAPIVPVGIWGTQHRWGVDGIRWSRPIRPRVGISFGPPIFPVGDPESRSEIDALSARIGDALDERVAHAGTITGYGEVRRT